MVRVMGASRLDLLTKLIFPHAAPYIFTAMRITAPGALIGAIIGEFLSANRGIGFFIAAASSRYDTARVFRRDHQPSRFRAAAQRGDCPTRATGRTLATTSGACGGPPMKTHHRLSDDIGPLPEEP